MLVFLMMIWTHFNNQPQNAFGRIALIPFITDKICSKLFYVITYGAASVIGKNNDKRPANPQTVQLF